MKRFGNENKQTAAIDEKEFKTKCIKKCNELQGHGLLQYILMPYLLQYSFFFIHLHFKTNMALKRLGKNSL